ncbi:MULTISPECIES: histidinol dehydrogenase [Streptomyces]|uniref:Histidinol dehydrogenase n=2 Tax=Streptomyces rimosus subsp. rimosus TaxID=132474 RepID=L8EKY0_STRR1|nr:MULTISPECIES: histidinol dehydrogenase [Streptomyces]KOG68504.1 histidinol dehydrogenase [Kitasatospora aureofaciens]KWT57510.1 histidinol dehydrogenase [Streptomyces albus subsp. albus]MYT46497.1 histidinol dehydrogenase [Streptomyces sp. SID5471]KUJ26170.1 histidinol dehydrogenase [Streptomyces rimosus subsp. rimosus]QDA07462.1 histidinol dehydrogenase [Streptomyces rimosus]
MISRIDLRGDALPEGAALRDLLPRAEFDVEAALEKVRPICEDVRHRGTAALIEYAHRFDGVAIERVRVPAEALERALAELDPAVRAALEESIRRARIVHREQRRTDVTTKVVPGGTVTERWVPVERVGLYVPGGLAVYPSSVVMNVVPAQEAGVDAVAVTSPPQAEFGGLPHPTILAACALLGVDEVYAAGGAQAIAMFAYGTEECRPVNLVTGPGNIYVAAAKRLLKGRIGIDAEAGPTEIAVLADATADAAHVAADLISQAEHDTLAAAVLVTDSAELAAAVETELKTQVAATKHTERISTALAGRQSAIVLVDGVDEGLKVVDAYGAEHLEIQTADASAVAARVRNAGAIFVGPYAPVSLGDYCAGSNHVLPTGGCACHSSGLSVQSFLRGIHVVDYSRDALAEVAHHVVTLAEAEDLPAHGAALKARFDWKIPQGE